MMRIIKIEKNDERICSSRVIFATLEGVEQEPKQQKIAWVREVFPLIAEEFDKAWNTAQIGDEVLLKDLGGLTKYFV